MPKLPLAQCEDCPLCNVPSAVPGYGPLDAHLVVVGEAPGAQEEVQGIPFVGQSGQLLDAALEQAYPGASQNIYKTNVVACRPPGNREPTELEIACCRPRLLWELAQTQSSRVLALGNTAHHFFGVPSSQKGAIYAVGDSFVMPAWHPAYILRDPGTASEFLAQVERAVNGPFRPEQVQYPEVIWMHDVGELEAYLETCADGQWVSFDIETDQIRWYATEAHGPDAILMLQLCWENAFAIVLDDQMLYDTPHVIDMLQIFFDRVRVVGQNAKFDAVFLAAHFGLKVHVDFDTMLAHYALDETQPHGLKAIARLEFGIPDYEEETITPYLKSRNDHYSKVPPEILAKYGCMDVLVTLLLRDVLETRLKKEGLYEWPFMNVLMEASNGLRDVELRGIMVDKEQLEKVTAQLEREMGEAAGKVREAAGEPDLNVNSTLQLQTVLYDKLQMPIVRSRKVKTANGRSTNAEILQKLQEIRPHPVLSSLSEYRRIAKMKSSYADNIVEFMDLKGRVHASFQIPGTEVGRLSVRDPALQTIPRPDDYFGALIRSLFVAQPGWKMVVVDYSQAELRVFACDSNEPFLIQVYKDGRDLHTEVALAMYGSNFTKHDRVMCKMFNFSYLYGGTEHSFAESSGLNIEVARQFVRRYNELMPVGLAYKKMLFEQMKREGFVQSKFGRRRHFPLITNENMDEARKASVHMPCASTASDLTLMSGLEAQRRGVHVVLTVHDSVIFEAPSNEAEDQAKLVQEIMEHTATKYYPQIPWKADVEVGLRWAEPKDR